MPSRKINVNDRQISIIIPVYNAEKYVRKCLESLLRQSFCSFEIICVDDGSTDSSLGILYEYQKRDSRIQVIQQKNQFAGIARNNGLKIAKGKYVLFLDSDDFFDENMLEKLWQKAEAESAEITVCDAFMYNNQDKRIMNTPWRAISLNGTNDTTKAASEIADIVFDFTVPAPWNKLFLRKFIEDNKLYFQSSKKTNDLFFVYTALICAEKIAVLNEKLLYYRVNNTASLQGGGQVYTDFLQALYSLKDYMIKKGLWELYKSSYENMALSMCFYNLNNMQSIDNYKLLYEILKKEAFPQFTLEDTSLDPVLYNEIISKKDIIIYGAGAVARSLIGLLLYIHDYQKEKINIVVTDMKDNEDQIYEIPIKQFEDVEESKQDCLVVIAVMQKNIQKIIEDNILKRGYNKIIKIGYKELSDLVRVNT